MRFMPNGYRRICTNGKNTDGSAERAAHHRTELC